MEKRELILKMVQKILIIKMFLVLKAVDLFAYQSYVVGEISWPVEPFNKQRLNNCDLS